MNTSEFIAAVKRAITVPTYQPRFTDDDFLAFANEEQRLKIVPEIVACSQNYFLVREKRAVTAGTKTVQMPVRAVGRKLKEIWYETQNGSRYQLQNVGLASAIDYKDSDTGDPAILTIEGDRFRLAPIPAIDGSIEWFYFQKPSNLVKTSRIGTIQSVGTDNVVVDKVPSNILIGSKTDITQFLPGFELLYKDLVVTNISGNQITFAGFTLTPIANVSPGDFLSTATETAIVQLPEEGTDLLVQATVCRVIQGLDFPEQERSFNTSYQMKLDNLRRLFQPRIEDQTDVLQGNRALFGNTVMSIPRLRVGP